MGQILAQLRHAVADHPAIGLDLGFTRTAEKAEAATLPFKMGPASNKTTGLIVEMGEFNLQTAFGRSGPSTEYLEDEAGPVDDFDVELLFKISLLDGT